MVAINGGNLDLKPDNVKLEKQQQQQAGRIEPLKVGAIGCFYTKYIVEDWNRPLILNNKTRGGSFSFVSDFVSAQQALCVKVPVTDFFSFFFCSVLLF